MLHTAALVLNRAHSQVRRDRGRRADMHKTVMRLIGDNLGPEPRSQMNLMWNLDTSGEHDILVVQATTELRTENLPDRYATSIEPVPVSDLMDTITAGGHYSYLIAANPTAVVTDNGHKYRVALYEDDANTWWERRSAEAGLELVGPAQMTAHEPAKLHGKGKALLHLVEFTGTAVVTDPELVRHSVAVGLGRGKAYGAGLLLLAPCEDSLTSQG